MIKKLFTAFALALLILGIFIIVLQQVALMFFPYVISVAFPWIIIMFVAISLIFHFYIIKYATQNPRKFINVFLGGTTIKLLIYFSSLLIVVFSTDINAKIFILNFAVIYLLFTFFEVFMVLKQLKIIQSNNLKNTDLNK